MSKYWIAILCALAFMAGGAAHLALNRPADNAVKAEFAPAKPLEAAPAERPTPVQTVAQAQPADAEDRTPEEAQSAEAEGAKAEDAVVTGGAEVVNAEAVAPRERRTRLARTRRAAAQRPAVTQSRVATAPTAPATPRNAGSRRGLKNVTVGGVKKTGSVLGKGLKKIGRIFND